MLDLPEELIFFVTSRCNLRCAHCFYWDNLGREDDLQMGDIEQLVRSLPTLRLLSISGGEPFLRKELVEICGLFLKHCQLRYLSIPTNALQPDRVTTSVQQILELPDCCRLAIGISLDGVESTHDSNRGVPGSFTKAVECCGKLIELRKTHERLCVNVLTSVTRENADQTEAFAEFIKQQLPKIDNLYWSVLRGNLGENSPHAPTAEQMARADEVFLEVQAGLHPAARLQLETELYAVRRQALETASQPVPCVAGRTIGVVFDNGDVGPCELLPPVGNIRKRPFAEIWRGEQMRRAVEGINAGKCACTHECFLYPSFMASRKRAEVGV